MENETENPIDHEPSRRDVMAGAAVSAAASAVPWTAGAQPAAKQGSPIQNPVEGPSMAKVSLTINNTARTLQVDTRTTLLDALRENLKLTGTKKGCDQGQCGACTVLAGGRRINSCLTLAVMHEDDNITTIEGLGNPESMHPMQAAFVKYDGYQCGYCTPGQICSSVAMLDEIKVGTPSHVTADLTAPAQLTADEIRERMSGNICRCGAYSNIVEAISEVAGRQT